MQITFWISLAILVYTFAGYYGLVFSVSKWKKKPVAKHLAPDGKLPTVTMLIAAYNEEKVIREKIENTLILDYPRDRLQIVVFSDGSTDATDAIVKSYSSAGIQLLRVEGRKGKTHCQNEAVKIATGDILIFSDANSMYDRHAIKKLIQNFHDEQVSVAVGELRYSHEDVIQEGLYWKMERFLKVHESSIDSCLGANGAIYAIRRNLYKALPDDAISDFIEPFFVYRQGYRVIYESTAFAIEHIGETTAIESLRKQRIITRTLSSFRYITDFLNPFRYGWYSIALWSHKLIRWFAFLFMVGVLVANIFLIGHFGFFIFFILQVLFYFFVILGIFSSRKIFAIPYYFVLLQVVSCIAVVNVLRGNKIIAWKKTR
jgi:cellulose synthase/poly-beta-1,6-N-acetylglucosamine synthase-like glycosyltransferase